MDGVVYEPVIPTITAFLRRLVLAGPNLKLDYDLHEPAGPEVRGGWFALHPSSNFQLAAGKRAHARIFD